MANRFVPDSSAVGPLGQEYLDIVSEKFGLLFDAVALRQTSISNVGNDYTITIDPVLNFDVLPGMSFYISPNVSNTGNVRMRVTSGNPYYAVVKSDGSNLVADDFAAGSLFQVVFNSGEFRIISQVGGGATGGLNFYYTFTASGVLDLGVIAPLLSPNRMVVVEAWGGGGGGFNNTGNGAGGGGGGGYNRREFRFSDLPSSITASVGAGGAAGSAGNITTFGALLTAYAGGRGAGNASTTATGGGGGGTNQTGGDATTSLQGSAGFQGGGGGSFDAVGLFGGGGGGGSASGGSFNGGRAVFGGGGGGAGNSGTGGISLWGGNGGANNQAGSPRGGGGGRNAAGGRGEIRVWI